MDTLPEEEIAVPSRLHATEGLGTPITEQTRVTVCPVMAAVFWGCWLKEGGAGRAGEGKGEEGREEREVIRMCRNSHG